MERIERLTKDRNWIKFRISGVLKALKVLPTNALSYKEKIAVFTAISSIENVLESFDSNNQILGIKKKKK